MKGKVNMASHCIQKPVAGFTIVFGKIVSDVRVGDSIAETVIFSSSNKWINEKSTLSKIFFNIKKIQFMRLRK